MESGTNFGTKFSAPKIAIFHTVAPRESGSRARASLYWVA